MDPHEATRLDASQLHGPVGDDGIAPADRDAVCRLARAYGFGIDHRDEALVRSLFTDDAVVAGALGMSSASEYVPKLIAGASEYVATQHNITNQYVGRALDDHADLVVHSYAVALHFDADGTDLAMGVEYRDRARHSARGWLISHRNTVAVWRRPG
ncbi:MAG TPA: nuclear transport factor 2 family protein [Acidimicrobiia bacterium]